MKQPSTYLRFMPMTLADLEIVDALEQICFPTPWSARTYQRELQHNRYSHYWVVRPKLAQVANSTRTDALPPILAYGGYWILGDDAHVATIASHPEWRRRGIAKWLLLNMLAQARRQGARNATLEVRVSNRAAQKLYTDLGFQEVGQRKAYYPPIRPSESAEDALLLTLFALDDGRVWRGLEREYAAVNSALSQSLRGVQPQ